MKQDKKILSLIKAGLSSSTLSEMTSSQINSLYSRLLEEKKEAKEATTRMETKKITDYTSSEIAAMRSKGQGVQVNKGEVTPTEGGGIRVVQGTQTESEIDENLEDLAIGMESDGKMDPDEALAMSMTEKFESKSQQKLFFAKCGEGKTKEQKKWCKMAKEFAGSTKDFKKLPEKKEETKEDFTFKDYFTKLASTNASAIGNKVNNSLRPTFESKLEESITNMVHKHTSPKMSKKDFIKTISEAEKEVETPVKPDVKPERPKPSTPYQPKHKPAPKAKEKEIETPVKPDVKPERPRPATPYQPKHKPAPKAKDLPNWLNFNSIGLDLK